MRPSYLKNAVLSLFIAVPLAACSSHATSLQTLPSSTQHAAENRFQSASDLATLLNEKKSPSQLVALQLAGRLPAPAPQEALRSLYPQQSGPRPQLSLHANAKVGIWATDPNFNYLLGQTSTGLKTVTAVDLSQNSCYSPVAVKVDRTQNVWVGCELISDSASSGVLQEYNGAGTLEKQFFPGCPANVSGCQSFAGYGYDSGLDAHGNVFASLNLYSIEICNPSCSTSLSAGFEWWPKGQQTATPKLISTGTNCSPVCGVGFMDVDASGNLWFTFSGYDQNNNYGFGLGRISNPTTKPVFTIVEPLGTYQFFGGVYAGNQGKTLNVLDQNARTISQYHLPLVKNGKPFNVLGPIPQNAFGVGTPTSGGFNQLDTKVAVGDAGGWLDIGTISSNAWSSVASPNFYSGLAGAAYTPSDK